MSRPARNTDRTAPLTPHHNTGAMIPACADTPQPAFPFLSPPVADDELGRVGHYRVLRVLGQGGMGVVFAAEDIALRRPVAIKAMRPELAADPSGGWQRFLREARALAAISHPNLVTVHQAFQERGGVFLVMELLAGESLEEFIRRPDFPDPREVARIGTEVAAGLAALHDRGLIHRDVKPANIWLESPTGRVRVLDLGLVCAVTGDVRLTEYGMVVGTPMYMSPEQARGRPLDPRTDLFSLGCVLFALCTGRPPFEAENAIAQAAAVAADDPPPVRELNPDVPPALARLIADLLAKNPNDRPASAAVVIDRLRAFDAPIEVTPEPAPGPLVAELVEEAPTTVARAKRKTKTKTKTKARAKPSFLRRHGVKLAAGMGVVVLAVVVVAVAGMFNKPGAKDTAAKNPVPPEKGAKAAPKPPAPDFLSDLKASSAVGWPALRMPPNFDGTIVVNGERSPKGVFMHPPPPHEQVRVTYSLGRKYVRFTAKLALNDSSHPKADPVRFVVVRDGAEWRSPEVFASAAAQACDLDVRGVESLTIGVEATGDNRGAHAVWVEPRLTK